MTDIGRKVSPPQIPDIPEDFDPRLREILEAIREYVDMREGATAKGTNARFVTIQDLVDAGVVADGVIE